MKRQLMIAGGAAALLTAAALAIVWLTHGAPLFAGGADPVGAASSPPAPTPISMMTGPYTIALQPGHWKIEELPAELARLRGDTGAAYGTVQERDINLAVVHALAPLLEAKGWNVEIVPATVPEGLRADLFVAIHADGAGDPSRNGWKLASPWRASPASRELAQAMSRAFAAESSLAEDVDGVTVGMRGYYAFNNRRFQHAISPYTPAVIVEMGFVTNAADRERLVTRPGYYAGIIFRGIAAYLAEHNRADTASLRPLELPWVAVGAAGAAVRSAPSPDAAERWLLGAGTILLPVDVSGDWYEVFVRQHWATGWVRQSDLVPAEDPHWLMPGELRPQSGGPSPNLIGR